MTLTEYSSQWRDQILPLKALATRATMNSHIDKYLTPAFGKMELEKISNGTVQQWITALSRTLAPKTVANIWSTFHLILASAKREELIDKTPKPDLPRKRRGAQSWLTLEQMRAVLVSSAAARPLVWLLCETGLRIGEVLALTRDCVNTAGLTLEVKQSVYRGNVQSTKTQASDRVLCISSELAALLSESDDSRFIFGTQSGRPGWPGDLGETLAAVSREAGVTWSGFHSFRHGNRTLMHQLGVPDAIAEQRMGHALPGIRGVYLHNVVGADRECAVRIADALKTGDL